MILYFSLSISDKSFSSVSRGEKRIISREDAISKLTYTQVSSMLMSIFKPKTHIIMEMEV